jgi:uncharacterized protein
MSVAVANVESALVTTTERIDSVDVLRGLALLGMIVVHFHDHSREDPGLDEAVRTLIWRLVEGKSHGTFALLFGAGFAIQLQRAEARGAPFTTLYARRVLALAMFGFVAHAGFGFNVLLGYAVWAVPLLLIRRWPSRVLVATALFSVISVSLYYIAVTGYQLVSFGPDGASAVVEAQRAHTREVFSTLAAAEAQGSYLVLLRARLQHMAWFYTQGFFVMPGVTLLLFITGMLGVRHGILEHPLAHRRALAIMMLFGAAAWGVDNWILPLWTTPLGPAAISAQLHQTLGIVRDQWLTFTYVGAALLLFASRPGLLPRLAAAGLAGRMALTNYLVQIAVLDLLFSGYALGVGDIRPRFVPLAALALFGVQVLYSRAWLRRYRFGPAEWLWRSITYGRRQPLTLDRR